MTGTEGQRLLRRYLLDTEQTQRALARRIGRADPTVSLWLSGVNVPDVSSAIALEDATAGAVPARAWATKTRGTRTSLKLPSGNKRKARAQRL